MRVKRLSLAFLRSKQCATQTSTRDVSKISYQICNRENFERGGENVPDQCGTTSDVTPKCVPGLISATLKAKGIEYDGDLGAGVIASPRMIDGKPVTSYGIPKIGKANVGKLRHPAEWSASNIPCPLGTRRGQHVYVGHVINTYGGSVRGLEASGLASYLRDTRNVGGHYISMMSPL